MKTFNLLGGQIVIDESKDKYHELKVVGENIRREIFSFLEKDFEQKKMSCEEVRDRIKNLKQSYIVKYADVFSTYIKQRFNVSFSGKKLIDTIKYTRSDVAKRYKDEIDIFINGCGKLLDLDDSTLFLAEFNNFMQDYINEAVDSCVYLINEESPSANVHVYNRKERDFTDRLAFEEARDIYFDAGDSSKSLSERKKLYLKLIDTYPYYGEASYFDDIIELLDKCDGQLVEAMEYFKLVTHQEAVNDIDYYFFSEYHKKLKATGCDKVKVEKILNDWKDTLDSYGIHNSPYWTDNRDSLSKIFSGGSSSGSSNSAGSSASRVNKNKTDNKASEPSQQNGSGGGKYIVGVLVMLGLFGCGGTCLGNCLGCNEDESETNIAQVSNNSYASSSSLSDSLPSYSKSLSEYPSAQPSFSSTTQSSVNFEASSELEVSASPEPAYNENDVVLAASNLLNAIKSSDEATASALIINDEELQHLPYLYTTVADSIPEYGSKEVIRMASDFKYTVGTPVIDTASNTASVDIKFIMLDMNQVLQLSSILVSDMWFGTGGAVDSTTAQYLNERVTTYIKGNYNYDNLIDYSEDELFDIFLGGTIGYCNDSNFFAGKIKSVSITHTLIFEYHDGGWKLSGCDNYTNLASTLLMGNFYSE